jgi:hypothetical protein
MSFARLVYYSAVIGGWSAFLAWLLGEVFLHGGTGGSYVSLAGVGALVGAAIGAGLNLVAGSTNLHWKQLLTRLLPGLGAGGIGGVVGILLGDILYAAGLPRAIGWLVMGLGIGAVEGLTERSPQKLRNGLIGGGMGGLLGGFLFDPLSNLIQSGTGMTSRATSFVILGICIGLLIGLAQVILKKAWLTVLDGYRPGRQLILSRDITLLGRGDHLLLPFMGPNNINLEQEHVRISKQPDGSYQVADNNSKQGSFVNNKPLTAASVLADGDVIKLGGNFVRFNISSRTAASSAPVPTTALDAAGTTSTTSQGLNPQSTMISGGKPVVPKPPPPPPSPRRDARPAATPSPANPSPVNAQPASSQATSTSPVSMPVASVRAPTMPPPVPPSRPAPPVMPAPLQGLPPPSRIPPPPPPPLRPAVSGNDGTGVSNAPKSPQSLPPAAGRIPPPPPPPPPKRKP